jgi:aryl-alcohol dehydrogenase-like predicted oxidoreductase
MKYNQLGTSDLKVSEISFGCMSLPDDQQESIALLQKAFKEGVNFFDTADLYQNGENEVMVGKAFKGMRDKVIIATKVGNQLRQDGSGWDWNPRKAYILKAVEKSLQRLQTDYIDLYQLHGGTLEDPIDETIEAFELLKEQGKIRYYGISSIRPNVIREWVNRSGLVSVMMQYSLLDRRPEEECLGLLQANKISVLARGSLAKGLLAGKQAAPYLEHSTDEVAMAAEVVREMAQAPQAMAALAIRFVLAQPAVATAVTGIRTEKHLLNNLYTTQVPKLSEKEKQQLNNAAKVRVYDQHRS